MKDQTEPQKTLQQLADCFSFLNEEELEIFLRYTKWVEADAKEIIADIGSVGESLYIVTEGRIILFQMNNNHEIEVGRMHAGQLVGVMSFFDSRPRDVAIRAGKNGVKLLKMTHAMYDLLRREHPGLAVSLLEFAVISLDKLIRHTSADITELTHKVSGVGYRY